jgi:hypothetical protein
MSNQHPIIPPPELVQEWWDKVPGTFTSMVDETHLATQAAQWGADQELEACCGWLFMNGYDVTSARLCTARRPTKPPSLKEQALSELNLTADPNGAELSRTQVELIRKALEAL